VAALSAFYGRRTWSELLYALIGFPLGTVGFVFVVAGLSVSVATMIVLVGFPLLALVVAAARGFGAAYRGLGRGLLGITVDDPLPVRIPRTWRGMLGMLIERNGWRAILFLLVQFPVSIVNFTVALAFWSYGLAGTTYFVWWRLVPKQRDRGTLHGGAHLASDYFLDTPGRIFAVLLVGVILLLLAPWVVRGVLTLDRLLIRGLLGPTSADRRIQTLEETRSLAVEDSAAALRRIERDLHDGAQARLVGLAMSLGLAKEELDSDDPSSIEKVRTLIDSAHREAKGTIVELRDLARGIHPPALDNGLPDALATLTARCTIPTSLRVELPARPSPAIETIVYFCTAELLTNAVKHSGAHHATVDVRVTRDHLFVRVGDDGAGGAAPGRGGGSGLAGLADRISTVDGRLDIASPEGGPTLVTIEIPTR
jgi:signal transduction histidine kinase